MRSGVLSQRTAARQGLDCRGQSLVEMALVLPILLAMLVGMFEFARAWNTRQVIVNAAREGARHAVLDGATDASVEGIVTDYLNAAGLDPAAWNITITGVDDTPEPRTGTYSTVQVTYDHAWIAIGPVVALMTGGSSGPTGTTTLSTEATMRNE